jgi:hypothetical protein
VKKRYSIWVREIGSDHDVELMQCDSNPQPLVAALYGKRLNTTKEGARKRTTMSRYVTIRVVDNHAET